MSDYIQTYLDEMIQITGNLDRAAIQKALKILLALKAKQGRLFFLGVGGGAGNAGHAVNDFRKIAGIEAYAPTDNVSELTARINDDGWDGAYAAWLQGSRLTDRDGVFVFSVGGGNLEKRISVNLVQALQYARQAGAKIIGVVGRDGGYTAQVADAAIVIPTANAETVTPHTESFQAAVWHLLVSHPSLRSGNMKWESVK
jgi:D-sedoheptulose 7-phosphate isomerase